MIATRALGLTMLWCCGAASADMLDARMHFVSQGTSAARGARVEHATLDDRVTLVIAGTAADGNHEFRLTIYDGNGRVAHKSESTITASNGRWCRVVAYGFNPHADAPGTWWYDLEVDGQPVVGESIEIEPSRKH